MAEMNRRLDNATFDPNAHWFPVNSLPLNEFNDELYASAGFQPINLNNDSDFAHNNDLEISQQKLRYDKKCNEFEAALEKRRREKLREEQIIFVRKWTNAGLQIVALITEHLISHPFVVLRRQCQVNNNLSRYHLVPVTLIPVIVNIHRWQGITCLWKGVGSVLVIKGLMLAIQDLISKITFWPKEVTIDSSGKNISKHIILKCLTCAFITPFYSASLLETVQSEIASEKPEFLDVFKEGLSRLITFGYPHKGRMIPVWSLVVPTAAYFIVKHLCTLFMKSVITTAIRSKQNEEHRRQGAIPKSTYTEDEKNFELSSSLIAMLSAEMALFPLETILHRLHLQGTRTIIDDLNNGLSVTPILTNFEGVVDCYNATIREEGFSGLYKGFGALIMQCLTYTTVIKLSKFLFTQISYLFYKTESSNPIIITPNWENPPREPEFKSKRINKHRKKRRDPVLYDMSSDSENFDEICSRI